MDPELVARLSSGDGRHLLDTLPPYAAASALALTSQLRAAGRDPDLVTAVLAQSRLRALASDKFGERAATMLFTADGLEQATRPQLAARHAERFAAAGIGQVADLGCGIGSDAMAFAEAGLSVDALDVDPVTAAIASSNLKPWPAAVARAGQATQVSLPSRVSGRHTGVWVDPARRVSGVRDHAGRARRVFALDALSPSWAQVRAWAADIPATGAKLSPAFAHAALPDGCEAQWTSWRGEGLECVVWWGPLVHSRGRTAAVCRPGAPAAVVTEADVGDPAGHRPLSALSEIGPWLLEADKSVVRAGLSGALPGRELSAAVGYASSDTIGTQPWLRSYRVIEAMPLRVKAIRSWLRQRDIGRVTLKKRGAAIDADALRRSLLSSAEGSAILVVSAIAGRAVAIVVERS